MIDPISKNVLKQQVPFLFYQRFQAKKNGLNTSIIYQLPKGYGYLMRSARARYHDFESIDSKLTIRFVRILSNTPLSDKPYELTLITTPGNAGVLSKVEPTAPLGINFTATPVKNNLISNYYYQFRENIYIEAGFSGATENDAVDLVLYGYLLPQKGQAIWM